MVKARWRPGIAPIFPPVIISDAITSVYIVIAVWMPVTVVPRSFATVAIDTFITDASRIMTNCAAARVTRTAFAAAAPPSVVPALVVSVIGIPLRPRCLPASSAQRRKHLVDVEAQRRPSLVDRHATHERMQAARGARSLLREPIDQLGRCDDLVD